MNILVIEDDPEISGYVSRGLEDAGYQVDCAADGAVGLEKALGDSHDAAVVDLMLPGMDGLALIEEMRAKKVKTPVIVLSAKHSTGDKVTCLRSGADDYLSKPFDLPELLARIEAIMRRSQPDTDGERLEMSGVVLDLVNRTVRREGTRIELPPREFALLEILMRNKNRPVPKSYLIERLWDYKFSPQTNLVDVLVCRLRTNIDRDFPKKLIRTVRGVGYVFDAA